MDKRKIHRIITMMILITAMAAQPFAGYACAEEAAVSEDGIPAKDETPSIEDPAGAEEQMPSQESLNTSEEEPQDTETAKDDAADSKEEKAIKTPEEGASETAEDDVSVSENDTEIEEEQEEPDEESLKEEYIASFEEQELVVQSGDYTVTASGNMPSGVRLSAEPVTYTDRAEELINNESSDQISFTVYDAFDIKIFDEDGDIWQPTDYGQEVSITVEGLSLPEDDGIEVHRISDDEEDIDLMESSVNDDGTVEFLTDHFTTFTISGKTYSVKDDWYKYWYYALDTEHNYIILITYGYDKDGNKISGAPDDVVVPATASIGGITYHTVILNNASMFWNNGKGEASSSHSPFYNNTDITSIVFEDKVYTGNSLIGGLLYGCESIETVDLSGLYNNGTAVNKRRWSGNSYQAFYNCRSLKNINFGEIQFNECYSMKKMFYGCESLESLDMGDWDLSYPRDLTDMFTGCASLKSLRTPKAYRSGVAGSLPCTMYQRKSEDSGLSWNDRLDLDNGYDEIGEDTPSSTWLYAMEVEDTTWQEDWKGAEISDEGGYQYTLRPYTLNDTDKTITIHDYSGNSNNVTIPAFAIIKGKKYDTVFDPITLMVKNGPSIYEKGAFYKVFKTLQTVYIDPEVKIISGERMFQDCSVLTEVNASDWDTSNITNMESMFSRCQSLTEIDVSGWNTENVTNMNKLFSACSKLTELDLSGFVINSGTNTVDMMACDYELMKIKTPKIYLSSNSTTIPISACTPSENGITAKKRYYYIQTTTPADTWLIRYYTVTYNISNGTELYKEYVINGKDASGLHPELDWYTDRDLTQPADLSVVNKVMMVYTAKFFTVRFHYNDGTDDYEEIFSPVSGKTFTVPSYDRQKDGKVITGWSTNADGSGEIYETGDSYTVETESSKYVLDLYAMYGDPGAIKGTFTVSVPALITLKPDDDGYLGGDAKVTVTGSLRKNDFVEVTLGDFDMSNRSETVNIDVSQSKSRWTRENISEKTADVSMKSDNPITGAGSFNGKSVLTIRTGSSTD